jgi:glyoxylase-like metal-dependent hydrolase (beta-lactamase superfamily II)
LLRLGGMEPIPSIPSSRGGDAPDPWTLTGAAAEPGTADRAAEVRRRLLDGPAVHAARTFDVMSIVYPARFAFWGAAMVPTPYVYLVHRATLLELAGAERPVRVLFNPTEPAGVLRAPFVTRLRASYGPLARLGWEVHTDLAAQLAAVGVAADDIDYLAFDHFHLQDLGPALRRFPRARLIAQRQEWAMWDALHPLQRPFFLADGRDEVPLDRVMFVDGDHDLGGGAVLVATPGHTAGNQTLFFRTGDRGIWGISENGVCADNWSPQASRIPGVADRSRLQELEVLPNLDTPQSGADHYTSMLVEKAVVDRVPSHPEFVQMMPSWEATRSVRSPGLAPTYRHGGIVAKPLG